MKRASIRLLSIFLTIILMLSLAVSAVAASGTTVTKNGIEAYLTTDKDAYVTGDTIDAVVAVKNNSGTKAKISVAITVPQGLTLVGESNYTVTVRNGKTHTSNSPNTGDAAAVIPAALLGIAAFCALIVLVVLCRPNRAVMSLLLVAAMVGGIGVLAVPAQAATDNTIALACPIKLDGNDANVTATVEFKLEALFEENFKDLDGWNNLPATGVPDGATVGVKDGELSIAVPTTVTSVVGMTHKLDNFTGKIAFEMDVTATFPNGAPAGKPGGAILVRTEGGMSLCFYIFNGKFGYYDVDRTPSAGVTQVGQYVSGTTVRLKMVADTAADTYDIFVENELLASGVKFRNKGNKFDMIQLGTGGNDVGATVKYGNLKISAVQEDNENSVLLEEDFADLNGWNNLPATGVPDGATVDINDGKLKIAVPTTVSAVVGKTRKLNNYTGIIAFEMDMTVTFPEGTPAGKSGGAVLVRSNGGMSLCFYVFNGAFGYYNVDRTPNAGVTQVGEYVSGTTVRLKMLANTDTDTYHIFINDELLVSGVKFRSAGDQFDMIQLGTGGNDVGATVTFDNLKISVAEEFTDIPADDPTEDPTDNPTDNPTEDGILFEEDFVDLEGWNDLSATGIPDGATADVKDGELNIDVPTTVSAVVGKTRKLNNYTGIIAFEMDMTVTFPEGTPAGKSGGAVLVRSNGGMSLCFYVFNGAFGYYNVDRTPNAGVTQVGEYVSGTTVRLKMLANTDTDTYHIFINDELLVSGVKFRSAGDQFDMIQLGTGGNDVGATVTFDNLKISVVEAFPENPGEDSGEDPTLSTEDVVLPEDEVVPYVELTDLAI